MKLRSRRDADQASPGRTGLYDLPHELLDWVISYADPVDFLNLSLVCKSFNRLVVSHLYAEYINTNLQYRRPISNFLLKVALDPNLAHHVRHVELGVWNTKLVFLHPGFRRDVPALPDDQFANLVRAAKQAGLVQPDQDHSRLHPIKKSNDLWCRYGPAYDSDGYDSDDLDELGSDFSDRETPPPRSKPHDDVEFLRCLKRGLEDPQVILLLSSLPRLQELSLRGPHMSQGLPWEKLCSHSLRSLTKIKLAGNSSDSTWDIAELNAIIRLPSLRELHGYMATSDEWDDIVTRTLQIEPATLSLTHINFERCALGNTTIKRLIEGCKALESFSYVAGGRYVGYEQFRAKEVKEHLLKHKTTLKYLALDLSHWDFPRNFKSFKSMTDFSCLEKVVMDYGTLRWRPCHFFAPIAMIQDEGDDDDDEGDVHAANTRPPLPDLLPKSLKELVIFQAPPVIVENLVAFETSCQNQHPHLKSVKIHTTRRKLAKAEDYDRLPGIFEEKGIEYDEPPITLDFPIPQMHDWIMDSKVRRMTRWNPYDKMYQGFPTRLLYRRFCEDVLGENPAANGGPLDPSMNFAYGYEDDLISYLDDQFEDELSDSELDSELDSALNSLEADEDFAQQQTEFDALVHGATVPIGGNLSASMGQITTGGLPAAGAAFIAGLNADLDVDEDFDSDTSSEESLADEVDGFYDHDIFDDPEDGVSIDSEDLEAHLGPMSYYEWDDRFF